MKPEQIQMNLAVAQIVSALQFYADPTHYYVSGIVEPPTSPIKADGGKRARTALQAGVEAWGSE